MNATSGSCSAVVGIIDATDVTPFIAARCSVVYYFFLQVSRFCSQARACWSRKKKKKKKEKIYIYNGLPKAGERFSKGGALSGTHWQLIVGVNCCFQNNLKINSKAEKAQQSAKISLQNTRL